MSLDMPNGANVVHVEMDYMWAIHDVTTPQCMTRRDFITVGTGWSFEYSTHKHIGTVMDGSYVWHVLEVVGIG